MLVPVVPLKPCMLVDPQLAVVDQSANWDLLLQLQLLLKLQGLHLPMIPIHFLVGLSSAFADSHRREVPILHDD